MKSENSSFLLLNEQHGRGLDKFGQTFPVDVGDKSGSR